MEFSIANEKILLPYMARYGLELIEVYDDEERIETNFDMVHAIYAGPELTLDVSYNYRDGFDVRVYRMPYEREHRLKPTLEDMDTKSHYLSTIRRARGFSPLDLMLHYDTWEKRMLVLADAFDESIADFLARDFSKWQDISDWLAKYRERWGLNDPIEPTD